MSPRVIAPVNPSTLRRIRELVGYAKPSDVDIKLPGVTDVAAQIRLWEAGEPIGLTQARKLAHKYRVTLPLFYLKVEQLPDIFKRQHLVNFRRSDRLRSYSCNLLFAIREARVRQDWLREYLEKIGEGRPVLPKQARESDDPNVIARSIRRWLQIGEYPEANKEKDATRAFIRWREMADARNTIIFTNNSHQAYGVETKEYDGLAMADNTVPVIVLNPSAKISDRRRRFTLIHELAHLFLNESAVSKINFRGEYAITNPAERRKEIWCNKVASEVLAPGKWLRKQWLPGNEVRVQIEKIAHSIHVSRDMLAVKARDTDLISQAQLNHLLRAYEEEYQRRQEMVATQPSQSGGRLVPASAALKRCGRYFSRCVLDAYQGGFINATEIYGLTGGLKLTYLKEFAAKLNYPLHKWK